VAEKREHWAQCQQRWDVDRLVFIDESSAKTNMTRLRGRARAGDRVIDRVPHGHWNSTTLLGSLRSDGRTTCMMIEGGTTREVFREYVRQVLAPSLRPGDIVIADNLSSHKDSLSEALLEACGVTLWFLPPYSPDFNPIEQLWSKVKQHLRSAKARTWEHLAEAVAEAMESISAQDAQGWFFLCGYTTSHS
jgi:transposase